MSDGYTVVQSMIDRLRELGQSMEEIAADIAPELRSEIEKNIAATRAPDGTPWKPTLNGSAPLQGAAKALSVSAIGNRVTATLTGIEARHQYGLVRGRVARPIIPGAELPKQITDLITRIAQRRFEEIMGGA